MNDREQAFTILNRVERENLFAAPLLDSMRVSDERDRRFIRTLVLGVLRWRSRLDYVIEQLSGRRISMLDPATRQILRLGIYQLLYSDVPAHAAVNEMVTLAARRSARSKGLINAVLRKASSAGALAEIVPGGSTIREVATRLGHPEWMLRRWTELFGSERAARIAEANQELSYSDLMINQRKISIADAHALLRERGVDFVTSLYLEDFVRLRVSAAGVAAEIERGLFYAMDEGSAVVASLVPEEDRRVLDFTAAPGGKSLLLASRGHEVVSHDISISRFDLLTRSAPAILGARAKIVVGDGRRAPFRARFDAVLLDAPCSATGTIRRNPELKWRVNEEGIRGMATLQTELLRAALDLTEHVCIYATCSLEREENDDVVQRVVETRKDFEVQRWSVANPLQLFVDGVALRLTPDGGTDGFTVHKLVRIAN